MAEHHLPVSTLPLCMLILTVFGLVLEPLQKLISRHYERQCDRYALERTGLREAYVSAFRKLARLNKDDPAPNRLEVFLFHSHPPIAERAGRGRRVRRCARYSISTGVKQRIGMPSDTRPKMRRPQPSGTLSSRVGG